MNARWLRFVALIVVIGALLFQPAGSPTTAKASPFTQLTKLQKRLLSGFAEFELNPANMTARTSLRNYNPTAIFGCQQNLGRNIKVNQNCLNLTDADLQGRGQAENETAIAQDPLHPAYLVAGFNDYRRGDGNCYGAYSVDNGVTWTDTTIPMGFTRGATFGGVAREYWEAGGDPSIAFDTKGNAYFACMVFQRGPGTTNNPDQSSAVYVFRSTGNHGASWNFPGRPAVETYTTTGLPLNDKPYMTVDNHAGSPFQDRIYVTWTVFAADGSAIIYEVHSDDYGQTFSAPVVVSTSSSLCPVTYGVPTTITSCNENQFSQPFTGSDGALYVLFNNFNNAVSGNDNRNQILLAKSTDGGNSFGSLVKVTDYYDLPDCATYQGGKDLGRACVPEKGPTMNSFFRASNYGSGAVDPTNPARVVVAFGSYINPHSNETNGCVPAGISAETGQNLFTGVKTPGACNNDILLSVSQDGGASFTGTTTDPRALTSVTPAAGQATTDQYWQWTAFTRSGKLAVSYFDRQYGSDETTGFSDVSLSGSNDLARFLVQRVTSTSMPPPTEFSGLFYGDYSGLSAVDVAHPIWMDTRNPDLFVCPGTGTPGVPPTVCTAAAPNASVANDQDIFTAIAPVP